jgi:hypothetical protein
MYYEDTRRKRKRLAKPGEHIMNKAEGKVMRRLKNETGLNEEEIRKIKKYRVMLSEAQVAGTKPSMTQLERARKEVMRYVCDKLKLSATHPDVREAYRKEWVRRRAVTCYGWRNVYSRNKPFKQ